MSGTYEKVVPHAPLIIAYAIREFANGEAISIVRVIHTSRDWPPGKWPEQLFPAAAASALKPAVPLQSRTLTG